MMRSTLVILILALSATANAEGFDYNYVFLGYGNTDFDVLDADGDGFSLGGSYGFTDSLHGFAGYDAADLDNNGIGLSVDAKRWQAGIGYNTSVSGTIDMFARLSYESLDLNPPGPGNFDDSGYGLGVGMRFAASEALELNAGISYVDYDDAGDDTSFEAGGLYNITDAIAVGFGAEWSDDVSSYLVSGRFYFGK